ncbi:MAG: polysaccharide biosynthesis tyrosine autokinase [Roseivirga sp.]|nr:polysaccharide biosynthesis tyrosine autokinase [Roseivirga sp.]
MSENTTEVDDFDVKYWLFKILGYWYLFVLSFVLSTGAAYLYLRYTPKTYRVSSSVLVADESSSNDLSLDALSGLTGGRRAGGRSGIESEISMIKSFDLIQSTLEALNFQVSYYTRGDLKDSEVFSNLPVEVKALDFEDQTRQSIFLDFTGGNSFSVFLEDNEIQRWACEFDMPCRSEEFAFIVTVKNRERLQRQRDPLYIKIHELDRLTVQYVNRLNVKPRGGPNNFWSNSNIIDIDIAGRIIEKNTTFLNTLVQAFIQYDLEERNSTANNTINFIDLQLSSITDSLITVENGLEEYRAEKGIIDLSSKGELLLNQLTDLENQKAAIDLNLKYYDFLSKYLALPVTNDQIVSPSTAGIDDPALIALIEQLNVLISEKVRLSVTEGVESLLMKVTSDQIQNVKERLQESIRNAIESSELTYNQIEEQLGKFREDVSELPKNERELLTIQRKFNINNELYTFLLKKKSESEIARAGNKPKVKVLDEARGVQALLIGPAPRKIYLQGNALGFILICGILGMRFFFQTRITDISQIKERGKITILGRIPHIRIKKKKSRAALISPKDPLSEAFRALKLNLDFIIPGKSGAKVIGITSAESGEGKTFNALNIAQVFAVAGKKVVLIGVDLRKPKLQSELELGHDLGLSNYFVGNAKSEEIIQPSAIENLDVIASGPIPPNPAELIEGGGFGKLIEELGSRYNYVVCDGPPIGLVTDYLSVGPFMDTTLFVVRLKYSRLKSTQLLSDYVSRGAIKSAHIIINDVSKSGSKRYGYGYGYGYESKKEGGLFSRLFRR